MPVSKTNALVFDFIARDKASRIFNKFTGRTATLTQKLGKLAKRAAFAAGVVGTAFATHSVRGFLEFNDAMNESLAIMGNVSGPMRKRMEKTAIELSKRLRFSAVQLAEGFFFLASSGFSVEESIKALPAVAEFAQAGLINLATASELIVDAQKALGLQSQDTVENIKNLIRVSDVMTETNVVSNATIEQVAQSLTNKAGPALRVVGKEIEEGAAVLAALATQGLKGKKAGLSLSIVLRELTRRAITHKEAFEEANIAVFDQAGEMRNLGVIVGEMEDHFRGMSDEQKRASLMMLGFTDRSIQVILNLLGTSDAIKKYEKQLRKAGGRTEEISQNQMKSFQARLEVLKNHVDAVALSLGEVLVNAAFTAGEKVSEVAKSLKKPWEDFLDFLLGPPAMTTGDEIIPGTRITARGLVGNVTRLKPELEAAWNDLLDTLFGPRMRLPDEEDSFIPGGARLGGGLVDQIKASLKDTAQAMIDGLTEGFETGDFGPVGEAIGTAIGEALKRVAKLADIFLDWVDSADWVAIGIKAGKIVIPFAVGLLSGLINSLSDPAMWKGLAEHWQEILFAAIGVAFLPSKFIGFVGRILSRIPLVGRILAWLLEGFASLSRKIFRPIAKFLGNMFKAFINGLTRGGAARIGKAFVDWLKLFPTRIQLAALTLREAALNMMEKFGGAILSAGKFIVKAIGKVIEFLTRPFRKAGTWLLKAGGKLIGGLLKGILNIAKTIGRWIKKNVIDRAVNMFRTAIKWLFPPGKNLIRGFFGGILRIMRTFNAWVQRNVLDKIIAFFKRSGRWLVSHGKNLLRGLRDGISAIMRTIGSWLRRNVKNKITGFFSRARDWLLGIGKNLIRGLKDGMLDLLKRPVDFFKSIGNKIISGVKSFFGIKSPSRVFAGLGTNLIQGFIRGMLTSGKGLRSIVGKVFGGMPSALANLVGKGLVTIRSLPGKAMDALESLGSAANAAWDAIFGTGTSGAKKGVSAANAAFRMPLARGTFRVGSPFGRRGTGFHSGQDFPASIGTPVFAPFSGRVSAGNLGSRSFGKFIRLLSGPWSFIAAHLAGFARSSGAVKVGDLLGFTGSTGRSTGPHLHAEFRFNGRAVNPRKVLAFAKGGMGRIGDLAMVGEEGPELVKFQQPARVISNQQSQEVLEDTRKPVHIENFNVTAFTDRFSMRQVQDELRFRGLL